MSRRVVLLAALAGLGWLGEPKGLTVQPWLARAGVRSLAVIFLPAGAPSVAAEQARWARLAEATRARGGRVVVVQSGADEGCPEVAGADQTLCDGVIFDAYRAPEDRPSAVVWDWTGRIVAQGPPAAAREALRRPRPRVRLEAGGDHARALLGHLEAAVRGTGKLAPAGRAKASGRPPPACPDGTTGPGGAGGPPLSLVAGLRRGRLEAAVVQPGQGCALAEVTVPAAARDLREVAVEAVGRLVHALMRPPEAPDLGAEPAVSAAPSAPSARPPRAQARPGVLVDPDAPVAAGAPASSWRGFAEAWVGTRYEADRADRGGMGGPELIRAAYRAVRGVDLTANLQTQLDSGPEVPLDLARPAESLVPGDLVFYVSYAYLPRSVSLYLGGGKVLSSQVIRGVVIDDLPKSVPNYLYIVARRPRVIP